MYVYNIQVSGNIGTVWREICQMEETLKELCNLCNSMNGLQKEIDVMEASLEQLDECLEYSVEHCWEAHGLLAMNVCLYDWEKAGRMAAFSLCKKIFTKLLTMILS